MSSELIRSTLAERAEDVAGSGPDLNGLHARVAAERQRRHLRTTVGSAVLVAVVAATAVVVSDGQDWDVSDPAPRPSLPTPTSTPTWTTGLPLPHRTESVEVLPTPYDRETVERTRVLTSLRNDPGDPRLEWTVDRTADVTLVQGSCRGAPGSRLVVLGGDGSSSATPCGSRGGSSGPDLATMPFDLGVSPVLPEVGDKLKAFVTTSPDRMYWREGRKSIPAHTSATVKVIVWGQDRSPVATLLGREVSPLATGAGRDWWFTRGVEAETGADSLTLELPGSPVDRVVQTVTDYARFPARGTMPFVQITLDGRPVDHRFDRPRIFFQDETSAFVPAGGPHTVVLHLTEGRPEHVDFAAAIFEAGDLR